MPEKSYRRDQLVDELLTRDEEFRSLFKEHQTLEAQLDELSRRKYLNTDEEIERKRIQKVKLQGKDRMEEILRRHSSERSASAA
jgi:uncharacterized protein YdcH (DUF465 family)